MMNATFSDQSAIKIIIRKDTWKNKLTIIWKLNNKILKNQLVKEQITEIINNFSEDSENDEAFYQNLCDSTKAILRGKFISLIA